MFFTSAPAKLSIAIFFISKRIQTELFIVEFYDIKHTLSLCLSLCKSFRIHIV